MLHVVESFGQLGHFRLTGRRQVGRIELAPGDLPGGADHLLHRGQQRQHREGHDAAKRKAERHHAGLHPFHPVAEGRHGGVSPLSVGDGRVQQLLGVLAQIAAAGYDLIIVELGGFRVLTGGHRPDLRGRGQRRIDEAELSGRTHLGEGFQHHRRRGKAPLSGGGSAVLNGHGHRTLALPLEGKAGERVGGSGRFRLTVAGQKGAACQQRGGQNEAERSSNAFHCHVPHGLTGS